MSQPDRLDPRRAFGDVLLARLTSLAVDYRELVEALERLTRSANDRIGTEEGARLRPTAATDIAAEVLQEIARWTPSTAALVRAAADYDRHVPATNPTKEG